MDCLYELQDKGTDRIVEFRVSYNIQTGKTTEVELQFIYADGTE